MPGRPVVHQRDLECHQPLDFSPLMGYFSQLRSLSSSSRIKAMIKAAAPEGKVACRSLRLAEELGLSTTWGSCSTNSR